MAIEKLYEEKMVQKPRAPTVTQSLEHKAVTLDARQYTTDKAQTSTITKLLTVPYHTSNAIFGVGSNLKEFQASCQCSTFIFPGTEEQTSALC